MADEFGAEPYLEYRIECGFGEQSWHTWRRFREFVLLRDTLKRSIGGEAKAPLPAKGYTRHATSDAVAHERMRALSAWLAGVLSESAALGEPALLAFVGLATLETKAAVKHHRQPLHVRALDAPAAESGDLMLFRTRATVPALQRAVTRSAWDHVGVLVFRDASKRVCRASERGHGGDSGVVECDMAGTRFYPLAAYESTWHKQYDEIAIRQIRWPGRGTDAAIRTLDTWLQSVLGAPYELTVGKITAHHKKGGVADKDGDGRKSRHAAAPTSGLFGAAISPDFISPQRRPGLEPPAAPVFSEVAPSSPSSGISSGGSAAPGISQAAHDDGDSADERPAGFFCSELVAHAYQALGLLAAEQQACAFWPVDFGERLSAKRLPLCRGATLGEEVPIDFLTPGVDTLVGRAWTHGPAIDSRRSAASAFSTPRDGDEAGGAGESTPRGSRRSLGRAGTRGSLAEAFSLSEVSGSIDELAPSLSQRLKD